MERTVFASLARGVESRNIVETLLNHEVCGKRRSVRVDKGGVESGRQHTVDEHDADDRKQELRTQGKGQ
jgi:hypothetical protein